MMLSSAPLMGAMMGNQTARRGLSNGEPFEHFAGQIGIINPQQLPVGGNDKSDRAGVGFPMLYE
jgi:hypothetical protein